MTGKHLSDFLKNIHLKERDLKDYEFLKKSKEKHIREFIEPFLNEYENILKDAGFRGEINKKIEDGDPGSKIIKVAEDENFSTVIMARRGMSELKSILLGSVSSKVIYGLKNKNIYIVGQKLDMENQCPIPYALIPVDGSVYSMKALEHGVFLAKFVKGIKKNSRF